MEDIDKDDLEKKKENFEKTVSKTRNNIQETIKTLEQVMSETGQELEQVREEYNDILEEIEKVEETVNQRQSEVAGEISEMFENVEQEELENFMEKPYTLLPKDENEAWLIVPKWVPFNLGFLHSEDETYNKFVINKYADWIMDIPDPIYDKVGLEQEYENVEYDLDEKEIEFSSKEERDKAWENLGGREGGLYRRESNKKIKLKKDSEFEVISKIIDSGNLPFKPQPVDQKDIRSKIKSDVELYDYQKRAWKEFKKNGMVGVYWPMGYGKTFFALYAGDNLKGQKLVIVPSSILEDQWKTRIKKFCENPEDWDVRTYQYLTTGDNSEQYQNNLTLTVYDECLSKDTEIETKKMGRISFDKIDESKNLSEGWNSVEDLQVKSYNTDNSEYLWDEVNSIYKTKKEVFRIKTRNNRSIKTTEGHTHMVLDTNSMKIKEKKNISQGDYLISPNNSTSLVSENEVCNKEAELVGWFVGDGCLEEYENVKFSFSKNKHEQVNIISGLLDDIGLEYSIFSSSRGDLTIYVPKMFNKIEGYSFTPGKKSNTVRIPNKIYTSSRDSIGGFLRGLFDAEGSVDKNSRIQLNTTSKVLKEDVVKSLSKLGIRSINNCFYYEKDRSDIYRVYIPPSDNYKFMKNIGFNMFHKSDRVKEKDTSPDTALNSQTFLCKLNEELNLTDREIANMGGLYSQTITGARNGNHRLGKEKLIKIGKGLIAKANESDLELSELKEEYNITYSTISKEMGYSISKSYNMYNSNSEECKKAVRKIAEKRKKKMLKYGKRLLKLENVSPHLVKSVDSIGKEVVYDLETQTHKFVADGFLTHNCHRLPANTFSKLSTIDTKYRVGLSATPYREDERGDYVFALTGKPVGLNWDEYMDEQNAVELPDVEVRIHDSYTSKKKDVKGIISDSLDRTIIFCDSIDKGKALSKYIGVPFVHGETRNKREVIDDNRVVICSRVADEGLSLDEIDTVIEYNFHGSSRRQELQRAGRVMHDSGDGKGEHIVMMTGSEHDKFKDRLLSLKEKGFNIRYIRVS